MLLLTPWINRGLYLYRNALPGKRLDGAWACSRTRSSVDSAERQGFLAGADPGVDLFHGGRVAPRPSEWKHGPGPTPESAGEPVPRRPKPRLVRQMLSSGNFSRSMARVAKVASGVARGSPGPFRLTTFISSPLASQVFQPVHGLVRGQRPGQGPYPG